MHGYFEEHSGFREESELSINITQGLNFSDTVESYWEKEVGRSMSILRMKRSVLSV
jgi:hypothetical protein